MQSPPTKTDSPPMPLPNRTFRMERSALLQRCRDFLPKLARANAELEAEMATRPAEDFDIEHLGPAQEGDEPEHIAMNLALGVFDAKERPTESLPGGEMRLPGAAEVGPEGPPLIEILSGSGDPDSDSDSDNDNESGSAETPAHPGAEAETKAEAETAPAMQEAKG